MAYSDFYIIFADSLGISITTAIIILTIIGLWSLVWKGLALWKSSKRNHLVWFIVFLVLDITAGILEILYIFVFSELGRKQKSKKPSNTKEVKKTKKK